MPSNDRLLRALRLQPLDRTPVWFMRQAGRYLPEYRALRAKAGCFTTLCATPDYACEAALQPLRRYPLDAAIVFSDILLVAAAMGLELEFSDNAGPVFANPLRCAADIAALGAPDPEADLGYVMDTVRLLSAELHDRIPLIGFCGSPWTLATYMVEGRGSTRYYHIKALLYEDAALLHRLLKHLGNALSAYLSAQVHAGAQVLMIFDTWGGVLTPSAYTEFSRAYMAQVISAVHQQTGALAPPFIVFTKGGGGWVKDTAATGCEAIGLDWTTDLHTARSAVGTSVCLQGNLDPAILRAPKHCIEHEVKRVLAAAGSGHGHIFNLGHGIPPDTPLEGVQTCIEAVHAFSPAYHL